MSMSKEEVQGILAELEADLKKGAEEAAATLKKADEGKPPEEDVSASAGGEDSTNPAAEPSASPDASASAPSDAGGPPAGAPGDMPPAGGDPAAEQALTPEALQAEYSQLPPEELDMHIQAALAAKEALSAAAAPAAAPAGAPPAGAPAPDASAGAPPMMGKEELKINKEATGGKISKSEEKMLAIIKSQQEDIENLSKVVKTVLESPVRKSVTALSDIQPDLKKGESQSLSKKEVDEFIRSNAHKMTKSERELWLNFVDKKVPASKLAPMLERLSSK